ncbi:helix-turn-helix domain-containing protein [Phyllobacterium sophorae]|uniref:Uncharacterized protein n=1 Tax=Phyllobacterium sophorae TaxID=1520277 RepID=A0A2P7B557_9HYPH|nr:helix-turn-helix transcriptional regulator [Phyllobacterium sophorae]PSH61607.1 hypothetical protein CU103_22635 [Phyllobacterium sophorae]
MTDPPFFVQRRAKGLSKTQVAKTLGRHQPFIANIESGQTCVVETNLPFEVSRRNLLASAGSPLRSSDKMIKKLMLCSVNSLSASGHFRLMAALTA